MSKNNPSAQPSQPGSRREQLRLEQQRAAKEKRIRAIVSYVALGLGALALVGGIIWAVVAFGSVAPKQVAVDVNTQYTVTAGKAEAPAVLDIYQDYMCPYCGRFERANSADLAAMAEAGQVLVRIHPMSFLDEASQGTKYSTRAANDLVTVFKAEPDKALAFNAALFANQPDEGTTGLSDEQIATLAAGVGISQATIDTFTQQANVAFVDAGTQAAFNDGITGTPKVLLNGKEFTGDIYTAGVLKAAVVNSAK